MKKLFIIFLLFTGLLTFLCGQETTEQVRVAVLPPVNTIGDSQYDIIGSSISETISLTLRLLGTYSIVDISIPEGVQDASMLSGIAKDNRLDNIIFGKTAYGKDESVVFDVSVYDRGEDAVVVNHQETAGSFFDTFEAADRMVLSIVESFSDSHIGWGTILLSNEGAAGEYDIYIDDTYFGRSQRSLSSILIGRRKVELVQDRPFGEYILLKETVEVKEEETAVVSFSIPSISEEEADRFSVIDEEISSAWNDEDPAKVEQQFALAFTLLENASASNGLSELMKKYSRWLADYNNRRVPEELAETVAEEKTPEQPVSEEEPVTEGPHKVSQPQRGRRIIGASMLGLGTLLGAGSLVDYILSKEMRYEVEESWSAYAESTGNLDSLYTSFQEDYKTYQAVSIMAYSFTGAGAALMSASLFILPEEHLVLSTGGRITAAAGLVLGAAGNIFNMVSNNQRHSNLALWDDYRSATEDLDTLYRTYEDGMKLYTASRIMSLSLWSAGIIGFGSSFLFPGEKTPAVPTLLDKILVSAGLLLLSGGNVTASMANNFLLQADDAWEDYSGASAGLDSLYDTYNSTMDKYKLTTYLSYGLWGAGTAAILTALIVPFRSREGAIPSQKEKPVELSFEPSITGGVTIQIKGRLP